VGHVVLQGAPQVLLIEDDRLVQALLTNRPAKGLGSEHVKKPFLMIDLTRQK